MQLWQRRKQEAPAPRIQIREAASHPFGALERYRPLNQGEMALYRSIREAVPIVDAAVMKLIRLCGGVKVTCTDKRGQAGLDRFLRTVNTGRGQRGIQSFLDRYLDDMLTYGRGVGEIVLDRQGQDIAALLCADPGAVDIKEGDSPLNFKLCVRGELGQPEELPWQDLLLYTPFQPEAGAPYGTSLLRSMPFLTELLLKIYHSMGQTWERAGTPRYAVICKLDEQDMPFAQERCGQIAQEWSTAMAASRDGCRRRCGYPGDRRGGTSVGQPGARAADPGAADRPHRHPSLPAGAVLVVHRTDERPTGGYADQRDHRHPPQLGVGGGAAVRVVADSAWV